MLLVIRARPITDETRQRSPLAAGPAAGAGSQWPWIAACLAVIPLLVYFLAYVPYLELGHNIAGPSAGPGYGWSLDEMHAQMLGYHFGLQAGHPSSSPWWSRPLDLKPVWFYGHDFDGRRIGRHLQRRQPDPLLAGVPALICMRADGLEAALTGDGAAGGGLRLPVPALDPDRTRHVPLPLPDGGHLRHGGGGYVVDEMLRTWTYRPLAIAFLVLARSWASWSFRLARPSPCPTGTSTWPDPSRPGTTPSNSRLRRRASAASYRGRLGELLAGVLVAVSAAAFALYGRELPGEGRRRASDQQDDAQDHERYRPQQVGVDGGHVLVDRNQTPSPIRITPKITAPFEPPRRSRCSVSPNRGRRPCPGRR